LHRLDVIHVGGDVAADGGLGGWVQRFVAVEGAFLRFGGAVATLDEHGAGSGYGSLPRLEMGWVIICFAHWSLVPFAVPAVLVTRAGFFIFRTFCPTTFNVLNYNVVMARPKQFTEETEVVSLRLPKSIKERVTDRAWRERRSMNQMLLLLIEMGLSAQDEQVPQTLHSESGTLDKRVGEPSLLAILESSEKLPQSGH
jgi:hypothetical protein